MNTGFNRSAVVSFAIGLLIVCCGSAALAFPPSRPNIILLNLDDADTDLMSFEMLKAHYPTLASIAMRSTTFSNAHCTTPFCAPSRAALFTGKYAFNNGCKSGGESFAISNGFNGGYSRYKKNGHHNNELGVWMKAAGYRTIHVGKFHHDTFDNQVPPGWDDISVTNGMKFFNSAKFTNIEFAQPRGYQTGESTYITNVDRRHALIALNRQFNMRPNQPFLLSLGPLAPHTPDDPDVTRMVEPRYASYGSHLTQPVDAPDFDEEDFSDKPEHLQRDRLSESEKAYYRKVWISRVRSMKSVDDMLRIILERIARYGQLSNTYIIISSDNGYQLGHHRMYAKKDPYHRSTNIPLIVAGPDIQQRNVANHLLAHIDICPTILDLGSAAKPRGLDGKSFLPLVRDPNSVPDRNWRRSIMIENWAGKRSKGQQLSLAYTAERYYDSVFVSWAAGAREYYDLANDPYQLNNAWDHLSPTNQYLLESSLSNFRQVEAPPNLTITCPVDGSEVDRDICVAGFMEDNSAALASQLQVKSNLTGRYFNGSTWQDTPAQFYAPGKDSNSLINEWQKDFRIFTEVPNGIDLLTIRARGLDDTGTLGEATATTHSIEGFSLFMAFNPAIEGKTFTTPNVNLNGYMGAWPNARVGIAFYRAEDGRFYNGTGLQNGYARVNANLLPNNRWRILAKLPPGHYRAFGRGLQGPFYQAKPDFLNFYVKY